MDNDIRPRTATPNKLKTSLIALSAVVALTGACSYWAESVQDALADARIARTLCEGRETSEAHALLQRKTLLTRYLAQKYNLSDDYVRNIVELAWRESQRHEDVSVELILAVMQKESGLKARAVSSRGAKGLMQVLPRYHPEKIRAGESLYDPHVNIRVGSAILQEYLSAHNANLRQALAKYSGGAPGYARAIINEVEALKEI
ncbi:MAG: lytic transglycosylase domain-containing protein [Burkholderiaceae bacterium]